jgi:uncharacterized small protein (DUF1192 family)
MDNATLKLDTAEEITERIAYGSGQGETEIDFGLVSDEIERLCAQRDRLLAKLAGFYTLNTAVSIAKGESR